MNAIEISSLEFKWKETDRWTLTVKDLQIGKGDKVFLYGPSGSGKTTLLDLLTGIHIQKSGSIMILGQDTAAMKARQRDQFRADHIGFIFQQFNLLPYLNVEDNVLVPCHFSKRRQQKVNDKGSARQVAHDLLTSLGIDRDLFNQKSTQISVGQQQRVAIARSLIGEPELIIADEPTSSLDKDARDIFIKLLLQQVEQAKSTIVFVSHDTDLAHHFDKNFSIQELAQDNL